MNWNEERYVRVYTRDTAEWLSLSFHAQALDVLIARKVDRDGRLPLGRLGRKAVAVVLAQVPLWEIVIGPALAELEAAGRVVIEGSGDALVLAIPDFRPAQEATASGAARQRKYREGKRSASRERDETSSDGDEASRGDEPSRERDECDPIPASQPCRAEPTMPCRTSQPSQSARARGDCDGRPAGGERGEEDGEPPDPLESFRSTLGERLGLGRMLDIGRDRDPVLRIIHKHLRAVGEAVVLNDCVDLAAESKTGVPTSLAWFVPWLERLPLMAGRAEKPRPVNPNAMAPVSTDFTETLADLRAERLANEAAQRSAGKEN